MSKNFARRLGFEQFEGRILLAAGGGDDWGDSCQPSPNIDMNWDGKGTALDALMLINDINWNGVYHLMQLSGDRSQLVDPDGDGYRGPGDVLVVINFINSGYGPMLMECNEVVYQQYMDLDPIVVIPGQKDVLVASVIFTAQFNNPNPVFLSQITAVGDVDFMRLKDSEGNWIGMTWFEYKNMGVGNIELNPSSPIQLNLFVDIPEDAVSGVLNFGLENPQFLTFPGEDVQITYLGKNTQEVNVVIPRSCPVFIGLTDPITADSNGVKLYDMQFNGNESPAFTDGYFVIRMSSDSFKENMGIGPTGVYLDIPDYYRVGANYAGSGFNQLSNGQGEYWFQYNVTGLPVAKAGDIWSLGVDGIIGIAGIKGSLSVSMGNFYDPSNAYGVQPRELQVVHSKSTVITAEGFGPGLSALGSIGWGRELGGDIFAIRISVAGPNLHGDVPMFLPIQSMTVKSAEGKFTDDTAEGWWDVDTLVENFTFNVPHRAGDIDYLFGSVKFQQELFDAVFWLTLYDQDGDVLATSDKAPVGVL